MSTEKIREHVLKHYAGSDVPLLLSDLGKELRQAGLWPIEGETRTLAELVEAPPVSLELVRDPSAAAHVIVVPPEKKALADAAIQHRRDVHFLKSLPRPVLLAFCVEGDEKGPVYVRPQPPFRYTFDSRATDATWTPIEEKYRLPRLYLSEIRSLASADARKLANNVREWAERHNIPLERLAVLTQSQGASALATPTAEKSAHSKNALERLYAAQPHGVAEKLTIPIDIALVLSRMP